MLRGVSRPRVRPVFVLPLAAAPERFWLALAKALARTDGPCRGQTFAGGAILRLRDADRRVWSPALHLHVDAPDGGVVQLHGVFTPSSPVWTAFLAAYLGLATVGIGTACWGGAQLVMQHPPWAFAGVPIVLVLAGLVYGASFLGQGLAAEDMHALRSFVERVADEVG